MKRFIFNADDFGWTDGHNRAVAIAHSEGVLDRASLMANGSAFADAVLVAQRHPALEIGVHLTLLEGTPVLHVAEVRPLLDRHDRFYDGLAGLARALLRPGAIDAVRREWRAQIARVVASGLTVSHLDSHKHVHMLPPLFEVATELALAFQVPYVRLSRPTLTAENVRRRGLGVAMLWPLAARAERRLDEIGLQYADHFIGFSDSGAMSAERLRAVLTSAPDGTTEVMMHPAALTDGINGLRGRYAWARKYRFTDELAALCDGTVRDLAGRAA